MTRFKDVISDLPKDKQSELITWKKKHDKASGIVILLLVIIPIQIISFWAGHYFGGWLH